MLGAVLRLELRDLRLCEADDHADGALHAADCADFEAADDQAAGGDDAVDDVDDDGKKADIDISIITINSNGNSVINTSSLIISNIKISRIKSTIRMIVNR